jgi:hypothetical protein
MENIRSGPTGALCQWTLKWREAWLGSWRGTGARTSFGSMTRRRLYPRNNRRTGQMRTFPVLVMPGGRLVSDLRIDAVSAEVAALVACGGPLIAERGGMGNLACEVFDGQKRIMFYRPPDAPVVNRIR